MVERWSPKPNVEGSSPSASVYLLKEPAAVVAGFYFFLEMEINRVERHF